MTKELFDLLKEAIGYLGSIAADLGYFADRARKEEARSSAPENQPAPAPQEGPRDLEEARSSERENQPATPPQEGPRDL